MENLGKIEKDDKKDTRSVILFLYGKGERHGDTDHTGFGGKYQEF